MSDSRRDDADVEQDRLDAPTGGAQNEAQKAKSEGASGFAAPRTNGSGAGSPSPKGAKTSSIVDPQSKVSAVAKASARKKGFLSIQGLIKQFGDIYAVDGVDLEVHQGEIFALLGSSGCGKSTLLRMLAGLEKPSAGRIILDGEDITKLAPYERPINMMFQSYALFPHMTVRQNIAFGLKQDKMPKDQIESRVNEMLKLVQMEKFGERKPHQLSGGQQQRIALARSLAKKPKLLLLDEPLGALDKNLRKHTQLELANTIEDVGVTCVMVTHDQEEAMTMATRIAVMAEGKLQQVGTPFDVYEYPNSRFTAQFLGETNVLKGSILNCTSSETYIQCGEMNHPFRLSYNFGQPEGAEAWVSLRPEDVNMYKSKPAHFDDCNWACGVVDDIAYLGSVSVYYVRLESGFILKSSIPSSRWYLADEDAPTWDETVYIGWHDDQPIALIR